jgi:hypothetical protein
MLMRPNIALVTTAATLALLGFAAPDLASAQTRPQFERKYIGTWCRVSGDPEGATLRREPPGKICSPERRVVITDSTGCNMFVRHRHRRGWNLTKRSPSSASSR